MDKNNDTQKPIPRDVIVSFRITADEAGRIDGASSALKRPRSRSDFCRATALYNSQQAVPAPTKPVRHPPKRLPALETRLLSSVLGQLGKLGSNINQMAQVANTAQKLPTERKLDSISTEITEMRSAISGILQGDKAGAE